jgi:hypothetical protein
MQQQEIKIGDIVRHRHILRATNLSVIKIEGDKLTVRYANNGVFLTQDFYMHEIELFVFDEDEFL